MRASKPISSIIFSTRCQQFPCLILFDTVVNDSLFRPVAQPSLATFNRPSPTGTYTASVDTIRLGVGLHFQ